MPNQPQALQSVAQTRHGFSSASEDLFDHDHQQSQFHWYGHSSSGPLALCVPFLLLTWLFSLLGCTEKELRDDNEIETELMYRKFVIFPLGERICLKHKTDSGIDTVSISFDFEEMVFRRHQNGEEQEMEKSFNEILLGASPPSPISPLFILTISLRVEFLGITSDDRLKVQYALGHQNKEHLTGDSEFDELDQLDMQNNFSDFHMENPGISYRSRDKEKLIERLRAAIHPTDVCCFVVVPSFFVFSLTRSLDSPRTARMAPQKFSMS